jgi:alpha amylase-like protein
MNARTHWWKNAKLYELYVDAFAGTFARLAEHLPYFTQLGVNCLHILPHFPSPMIDDGYDVADYRGVRSELGTIEDCTQCIEKATPISDLPVGHWRVVRAHPLNARGPVTLFVAASPGEYCGKLAHPLPVSPLFSSMNISSSSSVPSLAVRRGHRRSRR